MATGLAVALGAVLVWALAGKVFPSLVAYGEEVSRLRSPVGYWNALALLCRLGGGARPLARDGRSPRAVARGAGAVLVYGAIVAVALTYSRSGAVIMALAALAWVVLGRAAFETLIVLALAVAAAAPVLAYAFLSPGITGDGQPYPIRATTARSSPRYCSPARPRSPLRPSSSCAAAAVPDAYANGSPCDRGRAGWAHAWPADSMVRAGGPGAGASGRAGTSSRAPRTSPRQQSSRFGSLSSNHRWTWWKEAWSCSRTPPATGRGAGTFPLVNVLERSKPIYVTQPHNLFLQALSDTGIVGFLPSSAQPWPHARRPCAPSDEPRARATGGARTGCSPPPPTLSSRSSTSTGTSSP